MGDVIRIRVVGTYKQARVMLIRGKSELLLGMDIVKKLDLTVNSGRNQFKVGKSECGMMTFDEKHHLVLPLVPTACDYAKLNGYIGELRDAKIEVLQAHGDFCENLSVREVPRPNQQRTQSKMGSFEDGDFINGRYGPKYAFASFGYYFGLLCGGK